jgi:hypothetical protein
MQAHKIKQYKAEQRYKATHSPALAEQRGRAAVEQGDYTMVEPQAQPEEAQRPLTQLPKAEGKHVRRNIPIDMPVEQMSKEEILSQHSRLLHALQQKLYNSPEEATEWMRRVQELDDQVEGLGSSIGKAGMAAGSFLKDVFTTSPEERAAEYDARQKQRQSVIFGGIPKVN